LLEENIASFIGSIVHIFQHGGEKLFQITSICMKEKKQFLRNLFPIWT